MQRLILMAAAASVAGVTYGAQVPIAVTGFTQSFTVPLANPSGSTVTATYDGGAFTGIPSTNVATYYQIGSNTTAPLTGLPSGTAFVSASNATTTFQLQPAGVTDAILVDTGHSGTFSLTAPQAYTSLAFLASTGSGNNGISYTVHYADSTTQTGTFTAGDWFGSNPAIGAGGRVYYSATTSSFSNFADVSAPGGNPSLYEYDITLNDTASNVTSVDFGLGSGGGHTGVWAVSGSLVPEPGSLGILAVGALGLCVRRRAR